MTITRETLELAARAAGINLYWHCEEGKEPIPFDDLIEWNPLTDHGQLLNLAMACNMELDFNNGSVCYLVETAWNAKDFPVGNFPALAEAVIQAAAEQQLAKEGK